MIGLITFPNSRLGVEAHTFTRNTQAGRKRFPMMLIVQAELILSFFKIRLPISLV